MKFLSQIGRKMHFLLACLHLAALSVSGFRVDTRNHAHDAFAVIKTGGKVHAWGSSVHGGDTSSPVDATSQLMNDVVTIASTAYAFAALKSTGAVISWGDLSRGGSTTTPVDVSASLAANVVEVYANWYAFVAVKSDGTVVTWGDPNFGGSTITPVNAASSLLPAGGVKVLSITSNVLAFAALKSDASVVTWGASAHGGDSTSVSAGLAGGVVSVSSTATAFAALKQGGSVQVWGLESAGGSLLSPVNVVPQVASDVISIASTYTAFAALKGDGSCIVWGDLSKGGAATQPTDVTSQLTSGIIKVFSTMSAFAALKVDGSVVTWGQGSAGGDSSAVASHLVSKVISISATVSGFAAIKRGGRVICWPENAFPPIEVSQLLFSNVVSISSTGGAFAALKTDGSVVTWPKAKNGGNSVKVQSSLASGVVNVFQNPYAFAALKADGSVHVWGSGSKGGRANAPVDMASELTEGVTKVYGYDVYMQSGCARGTYSRADVRTECRKCRDGYTTASDNTVGSNDSVCTLCAAGYYGTSIGGISGCVHVPAGSFPSAQAVQVASTTADYWGISGSTDFQKLLVAVRHGSLYRSVDYGLTWDDVRKADGSIWTNEWMGVISSHDFTRLVAVSYNSATGGDGKMFMSANSGDDWSQIGPIAITGYIGITGNADLSKLLTGDRYEPLIISEDFGATWNPIVSATLPSPFSWYKLHVSQDFQKIIAGDNNNAYLSSDGGSSWTLKTSSSGLTDVKSMDFVNMIGVQYSGKILTSADSGSTWTALPNSPTAAWRGIHASKDMQKFVATAKDGLVRVCVRACVCMCMCVCVHVCVCV